MSDINLGEERTQDRSTANERPGSVLWFYLSILRRRVWIILPAVVVISTMGIIKAFKAPMVYRTGAKILIERSQQHLMHFERGLRDPGGWDPDFYSTQVQLIKSRAVMEVCLSYPEIQNLFTYTPASAPPDPVEKKSLWSEIRRTLIAALGAPPPPPPQPWELLKRRIRAIHIPDTHFLEVQVASGDPRRAALIANAAARAYVDYHKSRQESTLNEAYRQLNLERDKAELALLAAEAELQKFRETAEGIAISDTSNSRQPAVKRLSEISDKLTTVQLERIQLSSELNVMAGIVKSDRLVSEDAREELFSIPVIQDNASLSMLRKDLTTAEKNRGLLAETYGASHPQILAANTNIVIIQSQFKAAMNEALATQQNRLQMLRDEERELAAQYEDQKKITIGLAHENFELTKLEADVNRQRSLYEALVERMREVNVTAGLTKDSIQIVEEAPVPTVPLNAGKRRTVMTSIFMGMFVGLGLAFFFENLDDTVRTPEDVKERLNATLLGFIPSITLEKGHDTDSERWLRGAMTLSEPLSSVAEAYRTLRAALFYSAPVDEMKVLALTSCRPEEGKTTTTTNMALSIAQTGKRTLLIDGDLHRPSIHRTLNVKNEAGLTSILVGECTRAEATRQLVHNGQTVENLDLILAGPQTPNPSELLGSKRMQELIAEARKEYDWVLIDTPPVLFVSDASVLGVLADGTVIVVKAGKTTRSLFNRVKNQLDHVHVHVIGTVLNDVHVSRMGRSFSSYYSYGYSRYAKDYQHEYYHEPEEEKH